MSKAAAKTIHAVGTFAFVYSCSVFVPLGNLGTAFAIIGAPVAIFVAPLYTGITRGVWVPSLVFYGALAALAVLKKKSDDWHGRKSLRVPANASASSEVGQVATQERNQFICWTCNKSLGGQTACGFPGHQVYEVGTFASGFLNWLFYLVLARASLAFADYLGVLPANTLYFGILSPHMVWVIVAVVTTFAFMMTSLTQSARGGATRLLLPLFMGRALACGFMATLGVMYAMGWITWLGPPQ